MGPVRGAVQCSVRCAALCMLVHSMGTYSVISCPVLPSLQAPSPPQMLHYIQLAMCTVHFALGSGDCVVCSVRSAVSDVR